MDPALAALIEPDLIYVSGSRQKFSKSDLVKKLISKAWELRHNSVRAYPSQLQREFWTLLIWYSEVRVAYFKQLFASEPSMSGPNANFGIYYRCPDGIETLVRALVDFLHSRPCCETDQRYVKTYLERLAQRYGANVELSLYG